ncbi:unnamed protein product [Ectocarpus sp. 12 AP-2014]
MVLYHLLFPLRGRHDGSTTVEHRLFFLLTRTVFSPGCLAAPISSSLIFLTPVANPPHRFLCRLWLVRIVVPPPCPLNCYSFPNLPRLEGNATQSLLVHPPDFLTTSLNAHRKILAIPQRFDFTTATVRG